jgi:hypothetical protein
MLLYHVTIKNNNAPNARLDILVFPESAAFIGCDQPCSFPPSFKAFLRYALYYEAIKQLLNEHS